MFDYAKVLILEIFELWTCVDSDNEILVDVEAIDIVYLSGFNSIMM